jgi:ankyrin repeat protein
VRGDLSAVEGVLLAGVSPDAQDEDGDTPLLLAAHRGSKKPAGSGLLFW